jgi:hypothetical protein
MPQDLSIRFWKKVDKYGSVHPVLKTRCWVWTAYIDAKGYGRFAVDRNPLGSHQVSFFLAFGYYPELPLCVLHKCDNRRCVRPDHLFEGTRIDNNADMVQKNRQVRGELSGRVKLTEKEVLEIRAAYASGTVTHRVLAAKYEVGIGNIWAILHRVTWTHL